MAFASCLLGRPSLSSHLLPSRLPHSLRPLSLRPLAQPKRPVSTFRSSRSFLPLSTSLPSPSSIHQRRCIASHTTESTAVLSIPDIEAGVQLSEEQQAVLKLVENGESVFFTGSAGTGKSLLLKHIIKALRSPSSTPRTVAVTASTGVAAVNLGGTTLHSWAGIGLGKEQPEDYYMKWAGYKTSKHLDNWISTDVLIIDEISMIDGNLFDKLEELGRLTRRNRLPFGGIQVICVGDFWQLPPVVDRGSTAKFAFEADSWAATMRTEVDLQQVFRQADPTFVKVLDQMRHGKLDEHSISCLKELEREIVYEDGVDPVELYPVNSQADKSNLAHLRNLPKAHRLHEFYSRDYAGSKESREPRMSDSAVQGGLAGLTAPRILQLKVGASVMLIQNDPDHADSGLVNGSVGRVLSFHSPTCLEEGTDSVPFGAFRFGHRKLYAFANEEMEYPLVEFIVKGQKVLRLVAASSFDVTTANGTILAQRIQIPLILSWAISIHKSQGKTLERVKVDFRKVFEKGQAYVAASRCRQLETLQITNFSESVVKPHPSVVRWHEARSAKKESSD